MSMHKKIIHLTVFVIILVTKFYAQEKTNPHTQNKELGAVAWYRNYDEAIVLAEKEKKDIIILFQEVPGCATCRNYGHNVLSHPLMVEALENSFIPLAIFNNKTGKDRAILEKFNEPSWNNPVVRIIDPDGNNIVKRIGNDYSALTLCKRLKEALSVRGSPIPPYLDILEQEIRASTSNNIKEIYFKMYCFWTGEKQLGKLDGVVDVESGFIDRSEVVKVTYNSSFVNKSELTTYAKTLDFQPIKTSEAYKTATKDVHYYLSHSDYKYLPLSTIQKIKINSALGSKQRPEVYLSPKQLKWLKGLRKNKLKKTDSFMNQKIEDSWGLIAIN